MAKRVIPIALNIKYGVVLQILTNVACDGESPYQEFTAMSDAAIYWTTENLPLVPSSISPHMIIPDKTNLLAWCADNGIEVDETKSIEEIRNEITNYYETAD